MSKVIIALLILLFSLVFLLLFCIILMALALILFSKKRMKQILLQPDPNGG